uniref:Uncharacterized LOC109992807 n=1 Tax=Labrus bergylta TaxID=56723 RepID=A0A3Q3E2N5_9LABR
METARIPKNVVFPKEPSYSGNIIQSKCLLCCFCPSQVPALPIHAVLNMCSLFPKKDSQPDWLIKFKVSSVKSKEGVEISVIHHSNRSTMAPPIFAFYFTCLFMANVAFSTTSKSSFLHFQTVSVGESVTLPCACQDETAVMFYWYKQTLGQIPQLMTTFYKHNDLVIFHDKFKNNSRFSFDPKISKYTLKILDFGISDSATYFCIGSDLYNFEFCQSTTVSAKDLDIQAIIHQSVSETTTKPRDMTLTCTVHPGTCDGEHNVYWFKNSEESHPGLIYTHGGRNDQCERNPTPQTHSCVYNLPMTNLNLSHAGTYYCAVASCGHILFGDGTKLELKGDPPVLVYILSTALTFTTILVALLAFSLYKMKSRNCMCPEDSSPATTLREDADNLHYAALSVHRANRSRRQREDNMNECVYTGVRQ